jgi:hypothetical protein
MKIKFFGRWVGSEYPVIVYIIFWWQKLGMYFFLFN